MDHSPVRLQKASSGVELTEGPGHRFHGFYWKVYEAQKRVKFIENH